MKALPVLLLFLLAFAPQNDDLAQFAKLSKDKDFEKRCKAIDLVKGQKDKQMAQLLLPLLADPHERVVHRVKRALGFLNDPAGLSFLETALLKQSNPKIKEGIAEALGKLKKESSGPNLIKTLKNSNADVSAAAAFALGEINSKEATDALVGAADSRAWKARAFALEALGKVSPASAEEPCRDAMKARDYQVRMVAVETAPKVSPEFGTEVCKALMGDKDWRVRVSAIEATTEIRHRDVVGPMIQQFAEEDGRLRWDILLALKDLTNKDLGLNPDSWKSWWEANKETFTIVPKPKKGQASANLGKTTMAFFNVPILSTRLIFILDLSGSMRDGEAPVDSRGRPTSKKMLDVAKEGMTDAVNSLQPKVHFGLTGLGGNGDNTFPRKFEKTWGKKIRLFPASPKSKVDAVKFIQKLKGWGYSNDYDAIQYAFEDPDVDTIYLYSDGGTSRGTFSMTWEMLDNIQKHNRFRKIMIHTIEVPGKKKNREDNIKFLTFLAKFTKGMYSLYKSKE